MSCYTYLRYWQELYNAIKSSDQTLSLSIVETQEEHVLNMNEEYIDNESDDQDIWDSSDGGDIMGYPPDIQLVDLIEWSSESSENVVLTTETPSSGFATQTILYTIISLQTTLKMSRLQEDNPSRRLWVIRLDVRQAFYDRGNFCDAPKEFVIMNNFELSY